MRIFLWLGLTGLKSSVIRAAISKAITIPPGVIGAWPTRAKRIIDGEKQVEELLDCAKEQDRKAAECEAELAKAAKIIAALKRQEESVHELMLVA